MAGAYRLLQAANSSSVTMHADAASVVPSTWYFCDQHILSAIEWGLAWNKIVFMNINLSVTKAMLTASGLYSESTIVFPRIDIPDDW